jgi:hypothetical protein
LQTPLALKHRCTGVFIGTVLIGLPIATAAMLIFGMPAYYFLRIAGHLKPLPIAGVGALAGFITALVFSSITQDWKILPPFVGALVGFAAAIVWWLKAGKPGLLREPPN